MLGDFWMPVQCLGVGGWNGPGRCWGAGGFYETCYFVGAGDFVRVCRSPRTLEWGGTERCLEAGGTPRAGESRQAVERKGAWVTVGNS